MAEIIPTKKYLLEIRAQMIFALKSKGYDQVDISKIFNMDRSSICRILANTKPQVDGGLMLAHIPKKVDGRVRKFNSK